MQQQTPTVFNFRLPIRDGVQESDWGNIKLIGTYTFQVESF